VVFSLQVCKFD